MKEDSESDDSAKTIVAKRLNGKDAQMGPLAGERSPLSFRRAREETPRPQSL